MTKTIQRPLACLSAVGMAMAMLLYFPGGTFGDTEWGQKASAEGTTNDLTLSAIAGDPEGFLDDEYTNLFDNNTGTEWYCRFGGSAYVIFQASEPVKVSKYSIATARDAKSHPNKSPKEWTLSACMNYTGDTTSWTVIDTVTDGGLPAANETYTDFTLAETTPYYQYFKLEITSNGYDSYLDSRLQISEIALKDYTLCEHQWEATGETFAPTCTEGGYYVAYCPLCQGTRNVPTEDALWHDFVEVGEACTRCGLAYSAPIEPLTDEYGVYQIETSGELYWFANYVNSGNTSANAALTANIVSNTGVLKSDGTLADDVSGFTSWSPVGWHDEYHNMDYIYTGTFDGQNHTISGLYFNNDNTDYVGLFGRVGSSGSVSNVGIVDSYFKGYDYVGGVCGENYGTITNCYLSGEVTASGDYAYVGGVCGYHEGNVTNCYYTGAVTASSGYAYVGGVCGDNEGIVTNCYHNGTVTAAGDSAWVGGVCGMNSNTITNCYHTGAVTATGNLSEIGGVCGDNWDTVTNCYFDSTVYIGNAVGADYATDTTAEGKTTAEFQSGEVAYLLQSGQAAVNGTIPEVWGQNLDTDDYPALGGAKVYQVDAYAGCKGNPGSPTYSYANSEVAPVYADHAMTEHPANAATCTNPGNYAYWTCSYENGVYYKDKDGTDIFANLAATVIPASNHDYTSGGICKNCDALKNGKDGFKSVSLTLTDGVILNYYLLLSEDALADTGAYIHFTSANGIDVQILLSEGTEDNGKYKFSLELRPDQMADVITAQVIYSDGSNGNCVDYSVQQYANGVTEGDKGKALVDAMLRYGAYTQLYTDKNTDNLAVPVGDYTTNASIDESYKYTLDGTVSGVAVKGATLQIGAYTTIRLKFQLAEGADIDHYTFKCGDTVLTPEKSGDFYYVYLRNIRPQDLDKMYSFTVSDGTNTTTFTYSAFTYMKNVLDNAESYDQTLVNLINAMYDYHQAADKYNMETGWVQDGDNWYYYDDHGIMQTGWVNEIPGFEGAWFYFGDDGIMQTGWVQDGGNWYYLGDDGIMQTGWVQDGEDWYYLNDDGTLLTNSYTPDGNYVDETGIWIPGK